MGPGTDPHLFKPSLADVRLLAEADVIVAGGLHLEGKMSDVLHKLSAQKQVLFLSDSVAPAALRHGEGTASAPDPHIWFDVRLWRQGVVGVGHRLAQLHPAKASFILANTRAYADTLDKLQRWVQVATSRVPAQRRILVTSHDAFSYFGQAYGYEIKTLQGISTLSDFGLKDVGNLVAYLKARHVGTIFPETSMPPQTLLSIQEASARAGHSVKLGPELYTDALAGPGSEAATYTGMIRFNVNAITHAHTAR